MTSGFGVFPRALFLELREMSNRQFRFLTYAIAGPHSNIIGAYYCPDGYVSGDLNWPLETVSQTISEVSANGFVRRFGGGQYLIVPRYFEWNTIQNPNVLKAALKELEALPADQEIPGIIKKIEPFAKRFGDDFVNRLETIRQCKVEPLANTLPYPTRSLPSPSPARGTEEEEWARIWAAFTALPGFTHNADEAATRRAWKRRPKDFPRADDLILRIHSYGQAVSAANSKRSKAAGETLLPKPSNWLERDKGWESFAQPNEALAIVPECWVDDAAALIAEIGPGNFKSYFANSLLDRGPPVVIYSPLKKAVEDLIPSKFTRQLTAVFGAGWRLEFLQMKATERVAS